MKKNILKKFLFTLFFLCNILIANAQDKVDSVYMINGQKNQGKVTAITSDAIKFIHKGESLEYEFKKSDINKIEFSSGRIEIINNITNTPSLSSPMDRKGKIAVLPFEYITNDPSLNGEALAEQLQSDCYISLKENTSKLDYQDPITTNSILIKEGISHSKINTKSPKEMAVLLGVEYVIYGKANVTNKGTSTYGSGISTYDGKETEKKEGRKEKTKSSGTVYSSNNGTTVTNYGTKIDLSFYNDQGNSVYSESRNSFGTGLDAYHATLNYLIKRTPFGSKSKR